MNKNNKSINFLKLFVLTNGASITALELTASRMLAPYFGTSLPVWGSVIGITMIALALGYWLGGKISDQYPKLSILAYLTLIAGIIASLIPMCSKLILGFLLNNLINTDFIIVVGSLIGMTILFAIPILIMGMTSPFAIRICAREIDDIGQVAGSLYSIATIGSIFGVFLPSFIMVPFLGSRMTIAIFATLEILISLWAIRKARFLLLLLIPMISPIGTQIIYNHSILEVETPYQFVRIENDDNIRSLKFNEGSGTQSIFDFNRNLQTDRYWDYSVTYPYFFPDKKVQDYLIIGTAGGTMATNIRDHISDKQINITGIEIDSKVAAIAKKYFQANKNALTYKITDGRIGLKQINKSFDLIYVDAYTQEHYIPPHLSSYEFFQETKSYLKPNGLLIANVNSTSLDGPILNAIAGTLDSVYNQVWLIPIPETYNYIVIGTDNLNLFAKFNPPQKFAQFAAVMNSNPILYQGQGELLTDDRNPIELLTDWEVYQEIKEM